MSRTVENSLKIDAHYWASPELRRAALPLAAILADFLKGERVAREAERAGIRRSGGVGRSGFVGMEWHHSSDKSPAGGIEWAIHRAEADEGKTDGEKTDVEPGKSPRGRAVVLLLSFCVQRGEQKDSRLQKVSLDWTRPGGGPAVYPVFLCPFCGRRCRYLLPASDKAKGDGGRPTPRYGDFCCRACAGVKYASQLEYRSPWAVAWINSLSHACRLQGMATRLREGRPVDPEQIERLQVKAEKAREVLSRPSPAMKRIDARQARRARLLGDDDGQEAETPEREWNLVREWDLLPPPLFTPPKRRGRPSPKRARLQARLCARIVREAEREASPKRPAGRPRQKRAYDVAGRAEGGCAGRLAPEEGYCVGCRAGRVIAGAEAFTASNGRGGIKGKCAECGRGLCRMGQRTSCLS